MTKKALFTLLLFSVLLSCGLVAISQDMPKIAFEKYTLKNGLQVILHEDHTVPIVSVNIWYHVGSKNEKVGRTGFAHLFEHMMFQGSEHQPNDYDFPVEKIGGLTNGSTSEDTTNYWENLPSNYLELALWLESDRMGFLLPSMTQERLDNQRDVVKNERREDLENRPYGKVEELLPELLYPAGHPYSWPVLGSQEDLTRASKQDLEEFFKTYYTPNNASLCIAGDIDSKTTKALVEKYFANIPPGPAVNRMEAWIPRLPGEKRMVAEDRVSLPRLYLAWHSPRSYAPGDAELDLLANVLSRGKTSRLYKTLVYEKQIAQDVDARQSSREISSIFQVEVTAKEGHTLEEIEKAVDQELEAIKASGIQEAELVQAKNNMEADFMRRLESVGGFGGKADQLNAYNILLGNPDRFQWDLDRYLKATAENVRKTASDYLDKNRVVLYVVPQGDLQADSIQVDRSAEPKPSAEPTFVAPRVQKGKLSNGLEVFVVEEHKLPLVQVEVIIKSGWAADLKEKPGAASMTSELLDEGTASRSALQIAEETKALGASLETGSFFDASYVGVGILKKHLDKGLELMGDVLMHPTFPNDELERQRQIYLGRIMQEAMEPDTSGQKLFFRALYGPGHPYAQPITGSGTEASVKALQRADLVIYYETYYHPSNAAVIVVGDITLKEMLAKLEVLLKEWKPKAVPEMAIPAVKMLPATKIYLVDKPGAAQSVVVAGNLGLERKSPDYYAAQVLNNALGGQFTSRINMNLREEKGYTYGAFSLFFTARAAGPFVVLAAVHTQYTKETVAEIEKELKGICGEKPLSPEELQNSKNNLIKGYSQNFESVEQIAEQVLDQVMYGLPDDEMQRYIPAMEAVESSAVTNAAKKYIHPNALLYVIVGDIAKIEPGLRELRLGEIGYLDSEGNPISR